MQPKLSLVLLLTFAFALKESFQATIEAGPKVYLTANATSIAVGAPVKLRCELENFALPKEEVLVYFYQDYSFFAHFALNVNSTGQHTTVFYNSSGDDTLPDLPSVVALSSTFPVYEISLKPRTAPRNAHKYECTLNDIHGKEANIYVRSNRVLLTSSASLLP